METEIEYEKELFAPFGEYLDKFMPSEAMREYLAKDRVSVDDIVDIIYYSPAGSLQEKAEAVRGVLWSLDPDHERLKKKCRECIIYIDKALSLLDSSKLFSLEAWYFDTDSQEQESSFDGLYSSYADVINKISLWADPETYWFELTVWDKDQQGKMIELASYIIVNGSPVYCELDDVVLESLEDFDEKAGWQFRMLMMTDLNIPVPFKAGDVVEIGSAPFVPKQTILITDIGDNRDCCCVQGMGKDASGKYEIGAVKHGHVGFGKLKCFILPSYLYEIKKCEKRVDGTDQILYDVSLMIREKDWDK